MSKIQFLKANHNNSVDVILFFVLFVMSKIQFLKANHNLSVLVHLAESVVCDVKDTIFES